MWAPFIIFAILAQFFQIYNVRSLDVKIYYETISVSSREFIQNSFYPAWLRLGEHFSVKLIPFGRGNYDFNNETQKLNIGCYHGPTECYMNAMHTCALHLNSQKKAINFILCSIGQHPTNDAKQLIDCARWAQINLQDIHWCSRNLGVPLLYLNGLQTPKSLRYVPLIMFNDRFDTELQGEATLDLFRTVCNLLDNKPLNCWYYLP